MRSTQSASRSGGISLAKRLSDPDLASDLWRAVPSWNRRRAPERTDELRKALGRLLARPTKKLRGATKASIVCAFWSRVEAAKPLRGARDLEALLLSAARKRDASKDAEEVRARLDRLSPAETPPPPPTEPVDLSPLEALSNSHAAPTTKKHPRKS